MDERTSPQVDEQALILRIMEKDQDAQLALAELSQAYGPKVLGVLKKKYGDTLKEPEREWALNRAAHKVWRFADRYNPNRGSLRSWFLRIARNEAVTILKGEIRNAAGELNSDPAYDPADDCNDNESAVESKDNSRAKQLDDIIQNHLKGLEQAVAQTDLAAGGAADSARLAKLHGTSINTIYATRSKVRAKIRAMILEREDLQKRQKGKP
jgi:DNA-directed RNA polymerase specialized sigma24 family protein